jgi:hypothetical protein
MAIWFFGQPSLLDHRHGRMCGASSGGERAHTKSGEGDRPVASSAVLYQVLLVSAAIAGALIAPRFGVAAALPVVSSFVVAAAWVRWQWRYKKNVPKDNQPWR